MARDDFRVIDGGRANEDPMSQDDEDALAALAELIAGPSDSDSEEIRVRARLVAAEVMGIPSESPTRERP